MYRLNIFDQYGNVSKNIPESEIKKCEPEQIEALFPLLEAWADAQAADDECAKVEADKRKAETARDRAEKTLEAVTPKWTAHMEWQRTVARLPMPEPDPVVVKKVASATKARDASAQYYSDCVAAVHPAKIVRDQKRAALAEKMRAWSRVDGAPKNVQDLMRERHATETRQKLANIAAGLHPDHVEGMASTVGPSHLDRVKAGGGAGHRGSINVGYNRNKMRGAQLAPKLPSER